METIIATEPTVIPANSAPSPSTAEGEPQPRTRRLPYIACVVIAMVAMFANYLVAVPVSLIPGTRALQERSEVFAAAWNVLLCTITLITALVLTWWLSRLVLRRSLAEIGFRVTRWSGWAFLIGWAAAAITLVSAQLITPLVGFDQRTSVPADAWAKLTVGAVLLSCIPRIFQAIALQGIPEELLFRGWLLNCLAERPRLSLVVSALSFGVLHLLSNGGQQSTADFLIYALNAVAFGFTAGALALRFGSLWAAIGVHAGLHLTNMVLGFTVWNGEGSAVWLTQTLVWFALGALALAGWKGTKVELVR